MQWSDYSKTMIYAAGRSIRYTGIPVLYCTYHSQICTESQLADIRLLFFFIIFLVFKFVVEITLGAHTKSHICRKTTAIARKGKIRNTRTTNGTHTQTHSKQPSQYIPKHSRAAQTESISTFVPIFLFSHTHTWEHVSSSSSIHWQRTFNSLL